MELHCSIDILQINSCLKPTNKCWYSPSFLAFINTTAGPHFKYGCSQWSEPRVSCYDSGSDQTVHKLLFVATPLLVPEMNLIVSDIWISNICWWVPFQYHTRLVWVYSCCQILHSSRSEICKHQCCFTGNYHGSRSWSSTRNTYTICSVTYSSHYYGEMRPAIYLAI